MFGVKGFEAVIQPDYKVEGRGWVFKKTEKIPLTLYGFGSNQIIHVIAKCIFAKENAPILIEEPEVHLHPEKQALAADFLIESMKDNHQLFVTTHSEHIIGRLQRRIAEGEIESRDVCIIGVKHESESVGTLIEKADIDDEGIIRKGLGTYLEFFKEEMKATEQARRKSR
ncbi:hypothetical protein ES708_34432 [subsurface metagenome]